jgi:TrmH family RNA methyltransferase
LISLRKLEKMPPKAQKRKVAALLRSLAQLWRSAQVSNWGYWIEVIQLGHRIVEPNLSIPLPTPHEVHYFSSTLPPPWKEEDLVRLADELAWKLLSSLGINAADWNLHQQHDPIGASLRFPIQLYLDQIRSPYNLGAIFRTASAFGVEKIWLSKDCPSVDHPRCQKTAMGSTTHLAWERCEELRPSLPMFGLELGGTSLDQFNFPHRALVAIGSEEWGLSPQTLMQCKKSLGIVTIPLHGQKSSLNVAASVAILLYEWTKFLSNQSKELGFGL